MQRAAGGDVRAGSDTLAGSAGRDRALLSAASAVMLVYALALAVPNVFTVDGAIYRAMADALVRDGSLAIQNGYETYRAKALDLLFTVPVGDRLVSQYPGGWAYLAAPFYALGGVRGLFLLNALATMATIWLIRDAGRVLFGNGRAATAAALIYAFATFAFDYAGAVWPHAVTVFAISAATAAAARAWRRDAPVWALAAGLMLGLAVNWRVDAVFAAAAVGFWLAAAGGRPWASATAFAAGMVPGLALSAAVNYAKFGLLVPITYGRSVPQAGTGVDSYAGLLPLIAAVAAMMVALGFPRIRRVAYRPAVIGAALALLAVLAILPPLNALFARILSGAGALVIDTQLFGSVFPPYLAEPQPDGTIKLYGYYKKALLQSLPWLAGCLILAPRVLRGRDRAGLALLLLLICALLLPFAWRAWVGGRGSHMRYMVNLLPAAALLGGLALDRVLSWQGQSRVLAITAGALAVAAGLALGRLGNHDPLYILQISLPNVAAAALAVSSLAVLLPAGGARSALVSVQRGLFGAALGVALVSAWGLDLALHQARRAKLYEITVAARALPADAVIQAVRVEGLFERINRPPGMIALFWRDGSLYDRELLARVLAEGRPLYVQQKAAVDQMLEDGLIGAAEPVFGLDPADELYRVAPP